MRRKSALVGCCSVTQRTQNKITIYAGGPITNLTLAIAIDPELVITPRHEFNLWFDPEAAHAVLMAPGKKIVCTAVDIPSYCSNPKTPTLMSYGTMTRPSATAGTAKPIPPPSASRSAFILLFQISFETLVAS